MNTHEVKAFFEQTDLYLTYSYNLRIRAETVAYFLGERTFGDVLDMPCGTGDISAPLIGRFDRLTMMDFSENMIAAARTRIAPHLQHKADLVHTDFYEYPFGESRYDLVLNIGILAHIRDPWQFLERSMALVKPGGWLIIQNTDAAHPFGKLIHMYLAMRRAVGLDKYALNRIRERDLLAALQKGGFELVDSFSYNQSFLGFSRLFSDEAKYRITRRAFGYPGRGRGSGSDATFLLRKSAQEGL
jgi:ubiquinone/menaquinone biosynthesis C-methylase UbiE